VTTSHDELAAKSSSLVHESSSGVETMQRLIEMLEKTRYFDVREKFHFQFVEDIGWYGDGPGNIVENSNIFSLI